MSSQNTFVKSDPFIIPKRVRGLGISIPNAGTKSGESSENDRNPPPPSPYQDDSSSVVSAARDKLSIKVAGDNASNGDGKSSQASSADEPTSLIGSPNTFKTQIQQTYDESFTPASSLTPGGGNSLFSLTESGEPDYLRMILNAKVYDVALETPLVFAKSLSERLGNDIHLKREDLQPVFSFKCRGAYNKIASLTPPELARGVIAVSAGNHAQGVALAAQRLGCQATIVMPFGSPEIKWANVKRLGARLVLYGNDFDEAKVECLRLAKEENLTFIHPYDDPLVIAGQGTVGVEILRQHKGLKGLNAIFVCCGGGGLLSGIAAYVKRIRPDVLVFGVNTQDSDSMTKSLRLGHRVELKETGLFADGTSIRLVGKECFRVASQFVDGMVTVTNDEVCAAIKDAFVDARAVPEPSGALAIAGMKKYLSVNSHLKGGSYVAVISGANINFPRLRFVAERARLGEQKEALLAITAPEQTGGFEKLWSALTPNNITEISYRFNGTGEAQILLAFETDRRVEDVQRVISAMKTHGMDALDVSDNEIAKSHARFLIGGQTCPFQERFFRLRFPERPGIFGRFIKKLQGHWNFTLLHYRNMGGDVGRIMIGIQIDPQQPAQELTQFLEQTGFPFVEETENPVCKKLFKRMK